MQTALSEWKNFRKEFVEKSGNNIFLLKFLNLSFNETFRLKPLVTRNNVILFGVYGTVEELKRDRHLGILLLYVGEPIVYHYTFFVVLSYSDPYEVKNRAPLLLYEEEKVFKFFRVGVGTFDYFLGYSRRQDMHDEEGASAGSLYMETAGNWQDGM